MVTLTAASAFPYAGRDLAAGEEFEASASDAFILKNVNPPLATAAIAAGAPAERQASEQPAADSELFSPDQQQRRGRHNRRDMRAKD